jgi:transposase
MMSAIGIDTHKATLVACAIDELGAAIDETQFRNDPAGHAELAAWAGRVAPGATIGIEGSSTFGAAAARMLVVADWTVRDVPPHLTRQGRSATRRAGKSDPGDALAIARVTARETGLPPVRLDDRSRQVGLLLEAREALVHEATRNRNRLHAHLLVLVPGYGERVGQLVSSAALGRAGRLLRGCPGLEAELARDLIAELRRLDGRIARLTTRLTLMIGADPLLGMPGVGILTAARLISETGDVRRFRSPDAFAALAGLAPIPASSGQIQRVRLSRGGNRQLNRAFYSIALTQVWHHPPAKAYVARKRAEGKTWREAIRCLKRQLVRAVFRLLQEGQLGLSEAA